MTTEATPNNETGSVFLDEPVGEVNEFGGQAYEAPDEVTPEDRGDVLVDDAIETEPDENEPEQDDESEQDAEYDADEDAADDDAEAPESEEDDADSNDDDSDADSDDEAGDEDSDEEPRKPVPNRVPIKRLNKEVARRRAAEDRVRALEAERASGTAPTEPQAQAPAPKVDAAKFKEMQDAMLDGETEKALAIYTELQQTTVSEALTASEARLEEQLTIREQNNELRKASTSVRESFPELDPNNEGYDEKLTQDVVATRDFYMHQRGLAPGEALTRAAKEVADDYGLEDRKPAEAPKPKAKARKPDVKRKLEAAGKEKGKLGGNSSRNREELPDVSKLTDDQFARLDPKVKAKLRGDTI